MKNKVISNVLTKVDKNLPTILTGVSVVSGLITAGYALYAGFKMKEDLMDMTEDATTIDKVKMVAPRVIPVAIGMSATAGCAIAANHENGKRYAAVATALAATRVDAAKLQHKAEEILGVEKADEIKEKLKDDADTQKVYAKMMANADTRVLFRDYETGYVFRTTLKEFLMAQKSLNKQIESSREASISDFYHILLGDDYVEANVYNDVVFGKNTDAPFFNPDLDYEVGPDMQPVCVFSYNYATSTIQLYD